MKFIVIGITDHPQPFFSPEVLSIITSGRFFSGGKRHHEIMAPLLPLDAEWIDITVPLDAVFTQYSLTFQQSPITTIVVFASGDPLFYGFANTIQRKMPDAEVIVYPTFNSLQMLAHRLVMPYHDMRIVSLTGRPWADFDKALIERASKIGILTDKEHTPSTIAQRMQEYGYCDYTMHVGEHLGNPAKEKVTSLSLTDAAISTGSRCTQHTFEHPNCIILSTTKSQLPPREYGIPDSDFALLDGREKMITKMPIRLLTLQALDLPHRHVLWDIGFCTGSISIEARLHFPHLQIEAFEIRPECESIIKQNARRQGTPGISIHIGNFLETDLSRLPQPDAVFIGGHGGQLKEMMTKVLSVLAPYGVIVMNSVKAPLVKTDSLQLWNKACEELGLKQDTPTRIQLNEHHPITILKCRR